MMNKNHYYMAVHKLDELIEVQRKQPVTLNLVVRQKCGADSLLSILEPNPKTQFGLVTKLL